jgi:hypothetical protein
MKLMNCDMQLMRPRAHERRDNRRKGPRLVTSSPAISRGTKTDKPGQRRSAERRYGGKNVPVVPPGPALSRIRFFLGICGTVECGMEDGRKRHELHELSRKEGLIEPSGRQAAKPAPSFGEGQSADFGLRNGEVDGEIREISGKWKLTEANEGNEGELRCRSRNAGFRPP